MLDRKLFRDLKRLWAQALAIALVVAGGAATLVAAVGSLRSLEQTRTAYYERYQFADVFAPLRRAPKTLANRIAEIPGVAAVRPRMEPWLAHVFRVMGGYVLATGVLAITLATTSFRLHEWGAGLGALVGGAASIGLMAITNFTIGSDFKWTLLGIAALWAASLVAFALERSRLSHKLRQSACAPDV